jgi:hypothetical protein
MALQPFSRGVNGRFLSSFRHCTGPCGFPSASSENPKLGPGLSGLGTLTGPCRSPSTSRHRVECEDEHMPMARRLVRLRQGSKWTIIISPQQAYVIRVEWSRQHVVGRISDESLVYVQVRSRLRSASFTHFTTSPCSVLGGSCSPNHLKASLPLDASQISRDMASLPHSVSTVHQWAREKSNGVVRVASHAEIQLGEYSPQNAGASVRRKNGFKSKSSPFLPIRQ